MKAYTLRIEENLLSTLKQIGIKEKKTIREIILDALQKRIHDRASKTQELKERKMLQRAALLAGRISKEDIVSAIREDRNR